MKKYRYDPSSKKFVCPQCLKKRFVLFVDADNSYLPREFGKCDRELSCGYVRYPGKEIEFTLKPLLPSPKRETSFIEETLVNSSLKSYNINKLFVFLSKKFNESRVTEVFKKYRVGTSNYWYGSTVFWQIDPNGKVRTGKVMLYCLHRGKRIQEPFDHITWVHKLKNFRDFELKQVFFGSHLINDYPDKVVCLVESEKTALIMELVNPNYLWMAVGSLHLLSFERIKFLKGKTIVLFPDTDGHKIWKEKAEKIETQMQQKIYVSDLVINRSIAHDPKEGFDLADLIG